MRGGLCQINTGPQTVKKTLKPGTAARIGGFSCHEHRLGHGASAMEAQKEAGLHSFSKRTVRHGCFVGLEPFIDWLVATNANPST
jgi:hypothetical protein